MDNSLRAVTDVSGAPGVSPRGATGVVSGDIGGGGGVGGVGGGEGVDRSDRSKGGEGGDGGAVVEGS